LLSKPNKMKLSSVAIFISLIGQSKAFAPSTSSSLTYRHTAMNAVENEATFDPLNLASSQSASKAKTFDPSRAMSIAALMTFAPLDAGAAGPDWGIFEGRTGSLLHPVTMGGMLLLSLSTALKGFQYRRQRTMGSEISELKKQLPNLNGSSNIGEALAVAKNAEVVDYAMINTLEQALPLEDEVNALVQERKDLSKMNLKDGHFSQGATLAFLGTAFAIEGPLNTYARAGKLFPGPHLYAGAGLVVLWAAAYACVPAMQKGNDTARSIHIGANAAGIGLFAWQVVSGWPILLKVIEKTKWP